MEVEHSPRSSKKHKKRKSGDHASGELLSSPQMDSFTAMTPDVAQNGEGSVKKKRKKHQHVENDVSAPQTPADPASSAVKRKKKKSKHAHVEEETIQGDQYVENGVDPAQDSSAEFVIEEDDQYGESIEVEVPETPKAKKKKKHRHATEMEIGPAPSVMEEEAPRMPARPSLSLMSRSPGFFDAPMHTHVPVPSMDIEVGPALAQETDNQSLLRSYNEMQAIERAKTSSQRRKQRNQDRENERQLEDAEVAAARAQNDKDNEAARKAGPVVGKKSKGNNDRANNKALADVTGVPQAEILATKWYASTQLFFLAREIGLIFKASRFTKAEDTLITHAVQKYKKRYNLSHDDLMHQIHDSKDRTIWIDITRDIGLRGLQAVVAHGKRLFKQDEAGGKWTLEEDQLLKKAVEDFGTAFSKCAEVVGRSKEDCRDRWRNILTAGSRQAGITLWSPEEEQQLDQEVRKMAKEFKIDILTMPSPDIAWSTISKRMDGRRTRLQCSNRWQESTYRMLIGRGKAEGWHRYDEYMIIKGVYDQHAASEDGLDWTKLWSEDWCRWSTSLMRKRYHRMLKGNKQASALETHPEQIQALYDLRVEGVDVEGLEKPDFSGWKGLKKLPEVPLSSYGGTTKKRYTSARIGELGHTRLKKATKTLDDEEADGTPLRSQIKSAEFIEDSDEEAA